MKTLPTPEVVAERREYFIRDTTNAIIENIREQMLRCMNKATNVDAVLLIPTDIYDEVCTKILDSLNRSGWNFNVTDRIISKDETSVRMNIFPAPKT